MEHSVLHALELTGLIIALGGVFFVLGLVKPAGRALGLHGSHDELSHAFEASASRWVFRGALIGALATFLNLFVEVAEVQGKTIFSGLEPGLWLQFATHTRVGRLSLARIVLLLMTAGAARLSASCKWWLGGVTAFGAVVLTGMVSHAAAQPQGTLVVMPSQVAHITAAAIWVGVLVHLLAARSVIQGATGNAGTGLISEIVRRFSPVALAMTSLLALSGLLMLFRFLGGAGAVPTSAYGLTLMVKLTVLVPAIVAGSVNYRMVRPGLAACTTPTAGQNLVERGALLKRFGRMLELEVTAGILVITVAGILGSVSPPGEAGAYRLTEPQSHALLSPRWPATKFVNPVTFYGAATRTMDDFRYAEFTHHWSGVMVCLLGIGWLIQGRGGRSGRWAGNFWPFLLIPFAVFVAVASDPEVWLLRRVSLAQTLGDPQLLEHQLGAVMILVLVGFGWHDRRTLETRRPLGYALPIIMILGGLLLLGHAHSTLTITEPVTNLINFQHAILGTFIIFAGTVRWLSLRDLFPRRAAQILWPGFIIGLGLFMAFCYSEAV
ncbi:MAG: Copper resistance domain protein [Pedosphaera sp.]|nr:Copper resistance domain protein [Pedosphaera sp.]